MDSVRLEPHPPYICPTAPEARHWGATYALYRVRLSLEVYRHWVDLECIIASSFAMGFVFNLFFRKDPAITGIN